MQIQVMSTNLTQPDPLGFEYPLTQPDSTRQALNVAEATAYGKMNLDIGFPPGLPFPTYFSRFSSRRAEDRPFS